MLQRDQVEMVEELVARQRKSSRQRHQSWRGTWRTCRSSAAGVNSLVRMILMSCRRCRPSAAACMARTCSPAGPVARLATDARLAPGGVVGVGGQVVVRRQLAHVAVEAGGVEREQRGRSSAGLRRGGRGSAARRWPPCRTRLSCARRRPRAAPAGGRAPAASGSSRRSSRPSRGRSGTSCRRLGPARDAARRPRRSPPGTGSGRSRCRRSGGTGCRGRTRRV